MIHGQIDGCSPFRLSGGLLLRSRVIGPRLERDGYIGPRRDTLLLSDLVSLERLENIDILVLAPMLETLPSAGGGRLTRLTRLRTHLVAMDPVGLGVLW